MSITSAWAADVNNSWFITLAHSHERFTSC